MKDTNTKTMKFKSLHGKNVEVSFEGGNITSNAGLILLRSAENRLGLLKNISKCIKDTRNPDLITHLPQTILEQRVYAIAAGYEDLNDQDFLRDDACLQTACNSEEQLASRSTAQRFESQIDLKSCWQMQKAMVDAFICKHPIAPNELLLDFDPTDHILYGNQEDSHYNKKYKNHCYLPLHVFCGDDLLVSYLRPVNQDGAKHIGAVLRFLVNYLRQAWPEVKFIFRGDAGLSRPLVMDYCERAGIEYITGQPGNATLSKMVAPHVDNLKQKFDEAKAVAEERGVPLTTDLVSVQRIYHGFDYAAGSWRRKRRIVAKIELNHHGVSTRFLVTNKTDTPEDCYCKEYCPRGDMENKIKQMKLDLRSGRNSCQGFIQNQYRLLLSSCAYILIKYIQTLSCCEFLRRLYISSFRNKFIRIGAVIIRNTRRIRIMMSSSHPYQEAFMLLAKQLSLG